MRRDACACAAQCHQLRGHWCTIDDLQWARMNCANIDIHSVVAYKFFAVPWLPFFGFSFHFQRRKKEARHKNPYISHTQTRNRAAAPEIDKRLSHTITSPAYNCVWYITCSAVDGDITHKAQGIANRTQLHTHTGHFTWHIVRSQMWRCDSIYVRLRSSHFWDRIYLTASHWDNVSLVFVFMFSTSTFCMPMLSGSRARSILLSVNFWVI